LNKKRLAIKIFENLIPPGDNHLNSFPDEMKRENYLRINNTKLQPDDVAKKIKERFQLLREQLGSVLTDFLFSKIDFPK